MNTYLSETIKRLRKEKNLTQDDIASSLGISYQAVSRWETGCSYPDVELLPALASLFDVSLDILFCVDKKSEEVKIKQYTSEYDDLTSVEEKTKLTKKYISELPGNSYLKYRLISEYKNAGMELAGNKLDEMRKLCQFIVDHTTDFDWYRDHALNDMISVEEDDKLDGWLSMLDNRTIISSPKALTNRYYYRNEIDKYNESIQLDIVSSFQSVFLDDFCKRDKKTYKNAESRTSGQKKILEIINVMRDTEIEVDAWIEDRAFAFLRLAGGEFGAGNTKEGYAALEKAVDLYVMISELPDDTELKYNCPALDVLTEKMSRDRKINNISFIYKRLTIPEGWEWFNGVRNEERYKKQVERINGYRLEFGINE